MAATDRRRARDMMLPDLEFIRREARAALRAFYVPFSGIADAIAAFAEAEQIRGSRLEDLLTEQREAVRRRAEETAARLSELVALHRKQLEAVLKEQRLDIVVREAAKRAEARALRDSIDTPSDIDPKAV